MSGSKPMHEAISRTRCAQRERRVRYGPCAATNARECHLDRALLADNAFILHALVLTAQALVILDRSEDARRQPVALRFEGAIVDRSGFLIAVGPRNLFRAGDRNPDLVEDLPGLRTEDS
jgi:hypothetical protein